MNVLFKRSFAKDLKGVQRKVLRQQVLSVIENIEQAVDLHEIPNLKKLTADGPYYRIRIGDYRIGLTFEQDTITFVRFLHRRDIYRYFP